MLGISLFLVLSSSFSIRSFFLLSFLFLSLHPPLYHVLTTTTNDDDDNCPFPPSKSLKSFKKIEIVVNWGIPALQSPPAEKLGPVKATVGDTVVFKWGGGLSYALYQISKRESEFCFVLYF